MACYHPLKAWHTGHFRPDTGKEILKVTPYELEIPDFIMPDGSIPQYTEIPCGHCIGCRLEYSRQWANRCLLEMQYHESSWFVTLTYDDDHVPRRFYGAPDTGCALPSLSLHRRDVQLFFKRLRKAIEPQTVRFFGCGEYGPHTMRPHYHIIIFGLKLPEGDLTFQKMSRTNHPIYTSKLIERAWSFPPRQDFGQESYSSLNGVEGA